MRLQRIGKKGQAYFRVVVTEHTKKPQGEFLELLGSYDPHKKNLQVKKERINYWRSQGVGMSATLNNLLINYDIITGPKMISWKKKVTDKEPIKQTEASTETPAAEQTVKAVTEEKTAKETNESNQPWS